MEKIFEDENTVSYRLQCNCLSPEHAQDMTLELEEMKPGLVMDSRYASQDWRNWRERIATIWKILRGQTIYVDGFIYREEDLRPIADFLIRAADAYDKWQMHRVTEKLDTSKP